MRLQIEKQINSSLLTQTPGLMDRIAAEPPQLSRFRRNLFAPRSNPGLRTIEHEVIAIPTSAALRSIPVGHYLADPDPTHASTARGRRIVKRVPRFSSFSTSIDPRCPCTTLCTMLNPRPVPPSLPRVV